jgi:hypothetical protein
MKPLDDCFGIFENSEGFKSLKAAYGRCCLLMCNNNTEPQELKNAVTGYLREMENTLKLSGPSAKMETALELATAVTQLRNLVNSVYFRQFKEQLKQSDKAAYGDLVYCLLSLETNIRADELIRSEIRVVLSGTQHSDGESGL